MSKKGADFCTGIFSRVKFDRKKQEWRYWLKLPNKENTTLSKQKCNTELQAAYARDLGLVRGSRRGYDPHHPDNRRNFTGEQLKELREIRETRIPGKKGVFGKYKLTYDEPPVEEFMKKHQYDIAESYGRRLTQVELKLAQKAFTKIKGIYLEHTQQVYLDVANYIAEEFFNNDIKLIKAGTPVEGKGKSFSQVIRYMKEANERAPSKSWMYNALGLFVDQHLIKEADEETFHTYGNLPVSHRIKLLTVDNIKHKVEIIKEADKKQYRVRQLQSRIYEVQGKKREQTYNLPKVLKSTQIMLGNKLEIIESLLKKKKHKNNTELNSLRNKLVELTGKIDAMIGES